MAGRIDGDVPGIGEAVRVEADVVVCPEREVSVMAEYLVGDGVRVRGRVVFEYALVSGFGDVDVAVDVGGDAGGDVVARGADAAVVRDAGGEAAVLAVDDVRDGVGRDG